MITHLSKHVNVSNGPFSISGTFCNLRISRRGTENSEITNANIGDFKKLILLLEQSVRILEEEHTIKSYDKND